MFDNEIFFSLYYTSIYPYLNYCIHVWGKSYDTHLHHLIILRKKLIRIINGIPPRTNVDKLYVMHNILLVKRLYSYDVVLFMSKYSNQLLPGVFNNLFSKLADVHEYNTRYASTQHMYVCFQGTTTDVFIKVIVVLVSGIIFLIMLIRNVQLAHSRNVGLGLGLLIFILIFILNWTAKIQH